MATKSYTDTEITSTSAYPDTVNTVYSSWLLLPISSTFNESDIQSTEKESLLLLVRLIVQKICVPFVVLTGIVGNAVSLVVLTRKCMKSSTNSYLTALALFDLLYLVFSFTLSLNHYQFFAQWSSYVHCFPFSRVFTDMCANVSVILTVTFTVERYIGVCHPIKGRIICTVHRAKLIAAIVSVVVILCTAPEFWEMEVVHQTVHNQTVIKAVYTEFANRSSYQIGYYWFIVCVFTLLPLILLCFFNGVLICTVIKAANMRTSMTQLAPFSRNNRHSHWKEQQKITKMLITVVLVFIVCQLPGALLLLVKTYYALAGVQLSKDKENMLRIAGNFTNLLIQTNASINFILYSTISTKFRRVFYLLICQGCRCIGKDLRIPQSTFSRKDRVQMSSFYGGKVASSSTSLSTYTANIPQRLPKAEVGHGQLDKDVAFSS